MSTLQISVSKRISVPVERIYQIIADYRRGHPRILPKPYFERLVVEEGGIGAGTVIRFQMRVMGKLQEFHAEVSEPEPGRVLVETDLDSGTETVFTVDPHPDGGSTQVTITTVLEIRAGIAGRIEGWLTKRLLSPIYEKELELLAIVANQGDTEL